MALDGMARTPADFHATFAEIWNTIETLVSSLDEEQWATPIGCPGWNVRDVVAHIAGIESILLGRPTPSHTLPTLPHVQSRIDEFIELPIDFRRSWSNAAILDDFREVTAERLGAIAALTDADIDAEAPGLFGIRPLRTTLTLRIFDCWAHEQDIRRALSVPGGLDGRAARHSRDRMLMSVATEIQNEVKPAVGTTVTVAVEGPSAATRTVFFNGEKGIVAEGTVVDPAITFHLDLTTLMTLACGRHDDPAASRRVAVEGDTTLGKEMVQHFAFTP